MSGIGGIGGSGLNSPFDDKKVYEVPEKYKNIEHLPNEHELFCGVQQSKASVLTPNSGNEFYCEKQTLGSGTCGLHAAHHFVGTHCFTPKDECDQIDTGLIKDAIGGDNLSSVLNMSDDDKTSMFEIIAKYADDFADKIDQSDKKVKLDGQINIIKDRIGHDPFSMNDAKDVQQAIKEASSILTYEFCLSSNDVEKLGGSEVDKENIEKILNFAGLYYTLDPYINPADGTSPDVISSLLNKKLSLNTEIGSVMDFSPKGNGKLDYSYICKTLDSHNTDRAIVAQKGHFVALRKDSNGMWYKIDSNDGSIKKISELSGADEFVGIIYSKETDLQEKIVKGLIGMNNIQQNGRNF
ncbi:MAG: hypothetical protein LBI61_00910 [Puniceicoccales bacterium]|jgi:hypothetical protein|nr:hypothetical protein [Puniceicoccales bacterium]